MLRVVEIDTASYGCSQRTFAGELLAVVHVRFHRLVPRPHVGVALHPARAILTLYETVPREQMPEFVGEKLDAAIVV